MTEFRVEHTLSLAQEIAAELSLVKRIESVWNASKIKIYPPSGKTGCSNCFCFNTGWTPKLDITLTRTTDATHSDVDGTLYIVPSPRNAAGLISPRKKSVANKDPLLDRMWLEENDAFSSRNAAAHEFGHLLGLYHPGGSTFYPGNGPDGYGATPEERAGLMGTGEKMLPEYFQMWVEALDNAYKNCAPHFAQDKVVILAQ